MTIKTATFFLSGGLLVIGACAPEAGKFKGAAIDTSASVVTPVETRTAVVVEAPDTRGAEQVLCEEGPKVTSASKKADFSEEFKLICNGSATTPAFKEALAKAYVGTGTPEVKVLKFSTSDNFVTELALIYAIKAPLASPTLFAGLKPHDVFAPGIKEGSSELYVKVDSRKPFPGKGSVEEIVLNYDLRFANGASIHDIRRTEFNTYLPVETNKDIAVSAEHLLDVETNEYYHKAHGLTIGIKAEDGQSYILFLNNFVIKNRIDLERMKVTLTGLNGAVAKMLQEHLVSKSVP
ncbi:MAG: hypothetical protein M3Q07_05380 [Pseudobdellovibrionaceae bacterium]|uniref:hypothetical protein n=1 Tax=Oligoflexus sp. TaxID=1971216 RepID=UPI0027BF23AB|nr:hypothetical protein [Oligoflexus sp.]MDQ3231233.1 hypothetical protein [Pseudobdellovibrionaceae bacterium]HYX35933.1 hypothetical protein [Oligoflexus sp.]